MFEWGRTRQHFFSGVALVWRMSIEHLKWDGCRKRILLLGGGVPLLFYCVVHYTALHFARMGGREAALLCCYSKDGFPFSLAGVMDGLSNMVGAWVVECR